MFATIYGYLFVMKKMLYQVSRFCLHVTSVLPALPIVDELKSCFGIRHNDLLESFLMAVCIFLLTAPATWIDRRYKRKYQTYPPPARKNPS